MWRWNSVSIMWVCCRNSEHWWFFIFLPFCCRDHRSSNSRVFIRRRRHLVDATRPAMNPTRRRKWRHTETCVRTSVRSRRRGATTTSERRRRTRRKPSPTGSSVSWSTRSRSYKGQVMHADHVTTLRTGDYAANEFVISLLTSDCREHGHFILT